MKLKTVITLAALGLTAGVAGAQQQGVSKDEIRIGTIQDLSGPLAGYGKQDRNGMQLRIDELWAALNRHRAHLESTGDLDGRRRNRIETEVLELVDRELRVGVRRLVAAGGEIAGLLSVARDGRVDPHTAAAAIVEKAGLKPGESSIPDPSPAHGG